MKGNEPREAHSSGAPPSRSWMLAGCGSSRRATPVGIDQRMALAALDFLARVVTPRAGGFGCLDALAVKDRTARTGFASGPLTIHHDQCVIDLLEAGLVAECSRAAIDRLPGREVARQQAPGAAGAHHAKEAVDDPHIGQTRGHSPPQTGGK